MYFERLTGFNEEVALPFAQNLMEYYSEVGEMRIEVYKQIIIEVTSLTRQERVGLVRNSLCQAQKNIS